MATDILHVNDVGIPIQCTVINRRTKQPVDLSDFVSGKIRLRKPDGVTVVNKTAILAGDGTDGVVQYVLQAGDIDVAGRWHGQAVDIIAASSGPWSTDWDGFLVRENL